MRILLLVDRFPPSKIGGVWEAAHQLRLAYESEGHTVFVLTNGEFAPTENRKYINRTGFGLFLGTFLIMCRLINFCRRYEIDLIHAHQPLSSPALLFVRLFISRIRIVTSFHTTYFSEYSSITSRQISGKIYRPDYFEYFRKYVTSPTHILLDLIAYVIADEVTAVSSTVKIELQKTYGRISQKEVQIVSNGVVVSDESQEVTMKDRFVFFAGAFKARKGVWELLNAFGMIDQQDLKLVIAGEGRGYEKLVRQEIKILGLENRVLLLGKISNSSVRSWLLDCEVFCLPSLMEGHPIVLLEAMAAGAAIVATDIGGVNDMIEDGISGMLVPPGDVMALAEAISRLASNADLRSSLGRNARTKVKKHYQWESQAREYLNLFQRGRCQRDFDWEVSTKAEFNPQ